MIGSTNVEGGQRVREVGETVFGTPSTSVWVVRRTWRGFGGLDYVEIVLAGDPVRKKTISTGTLADRKLFVPDTERIGVLQNPLGR